MIPNKQIIEVWGDFACFSRPEMKVERFSYPVMTPSAARGILDAIHVKPEKFRWQVLQIEMLSPLRYMALLRNEVKSKAPGDRTIGQWMQNTQEVSPIWADDPSERTQRQTMALKAVQYRIHAEIRAWPEFANELPALEAQFRRRAAAGQCFHQPYLGCREFPAYFRLIDESESLAPCFPLDMQIGWMLYDVFDLSKKGYKTDPPFITLFNAAIRNGVLNVPDFTGSEVHRPTRRE
jgi:CRISPR-associated protein Cas5d